MSSTQDFPKNELSVSADGALAALGRFPEHGVQLVEAWVKNNNAAAVAEAADRAAGPVRKAARRGLSVLRSRGVTVPEKGRVAKLASSSEPETTEAWMLAPDTAGNVLLVIASRSKTSRYKAAFFFVHDVQGVQRVEVSELSHSGLKKSIARVLPSARYKPVSVPVEWAPPPRGAGQGGPRRNGKASALGHRQRQRSLGAHARKSPRAPLRLRRARTLRGRRQGARHGFGKAACVTRVLRLVSSRRSRR